MLTVIWASASLSGAGAGVSTSLMSITAASLLGSAVFISASYSHDELKHNRKAVLARIHAKYGDSLDEKRRGLENFRDEGKKWEVDGSYIQYS